MSENILKPSRRGLLKTVTMATAAMAIGTKSTGAIAKSIVEPVVPLESPVRLASPALGMKKSFFVQSYINPKDKIKLEPGSIFIENDRMPMFSITSNVVPYYPDPYSAFMSIKDDLEERPFGYDRVAIIRAGNEIAKRSRRGIAKFIYTSDEKFYNDIVTRNFDVERIAYRIKFDPNIDGTYLLYMGNSPYDQTICHAAYVGAGQDEKCYEEVFECLDLTQDENGSEYKKAYFRGNVLLLPSRVAPLPENVKVGDVVYYIHPKYKDMAFKLV